MRLHLTRFTTPNLDDCQFFFKYYGENVIVQSWSSKETCRRIKIAHLWTSRTKLHSLYARHAHNNGHSVCSCRNSRTLTGINPDSWCV